MNHHSALAKPSSLEPQVFDGLERAAVEGPLQAFQVHERVGWEAQRGVGLEERERFVVDLSASLRQAQATARDGKVGFVLYEGGVECVAVDEVADLGREAQQRRFDRISLETYTRSQKVATRGRPRCLLLLYSGIVGADRSREFAVQ